MRTILEVARGLRRAAVALAALLAVAALAACGGDSGDSGDRDKVSPAVRTHTTDDIKAVGFKTNKQYDVEGLPAALDAWFGIWGPAGGQRQDYELRIYPSHEDAVEHGTALGDEGTGEDAKLLEKDIPTWTEGLKERRRSATVTDISGASGQDAVSPGAGYADYSIYGNVMLLCAGANPEHSLERCNPLIDALEAAESSG